MVIRSSRPQTSRCRPACRGSAVSSRIARHRPRSAASGNSTAAPPTRETATTGRPRRRGPKAEERDGSEEGRAAGRRLPGETPRPARRRTRRRALRAPISARACSANLRSTRLGLRGEQLKPTWLAPSSAATDVPGPRQPADLDARHRSPRRPRRTHFGLVGTQQRLADKESPYRGRERFDVPGATGFRSRQLERLEKVSPRRGKTRSSR